MSILGSAAATLIMLVASAAASGAQSSEGYVDGTDDVRLFYRRVGAAPSVAILLHGGPGSNMNAVWSDLQPLADVRAIVMYDQRGGGRSQVITDPARLTAEHHVRDIEALRGSWASNGLP